MAFIAYPAFFSTGSNSNLQTCWLFGRRRVISFLWLTRRAGPWDMWVVTMSSLLVLGGVVLFAISPTLGYVPVLPLLVGVIGVILARGRLGNSWAVSLRYPESTQEPGACARKHWTTKRDKEDYECQP